MPQLIRPYLVLFGDNAINWPTEPSMVDAFAGGALDFFF